MAPDYSNRQCLDTQQPGKDVSRLLNTRQSEIFEGFDRKAYLNVLKVFDICLELPSDSEKYFSLVVDEFSELVHTRKFRCLRVA